MQKWNGQLLRKFDDPTEGNASVGTTVVVRNTSNNSLAVIYDVDDTNSVQKNNPFVTDDFGRYSFYAPSGKYTVEFGDGSDSIEITLVDNLSFQDINGLTERSDLAQRSRFETTVAEITLGNFKVGDKLTVIDRANSDWDIVIGGVVDGITVLDSGGGSTAVLRIVDGIDLEAFGAKESATDTQNFNALSAAVRSEIKFTSQDKTYTVATGSIDATVKILNWQANGTRIKLAAGAKSSALFVLNGGWSYNLSGMTFDGNRLNVSGNNAGFFVITNCASFVAENTRFEDLRRYGYNIIGDNPYNSNVKITNLRCDNIGVHGESDGGPAGYVAALGEAVKCEHVRNLVIDGFEVKNTSGTGDGQVQKAFYCVNVNITNIDLDNVGPSFKYPAISNVRCVNISYENANIVGASQVCIEDNANLSASYTNILTFGRKAYISSSDGAEFSARAPQDTNIVNWKDTSTDATAFNIVPIEGMTMTRVTTNQNINISRDDPSTDRRSRDIQLNDVTCNNLSTLLTQGFLELNSCDIIGQWTSTHIGTALDNNSSIGAYTDSGQSTTQLVRMKPSTQGIQFSLSLDPSQSKSIKLPTNISNLPLAGKVSAYNFFGDSLSTQFSMIDWSFYDAGTPTVFKSIAGSGATPRSGITMTVSASNRTLTFNNTDTVSTTVAGIVNIIDRSLYLG